MKTTTNELDALIAIGKQVKAARLAKYLGLTDLSHRTGLSLPTISNLEQGRHYPSRRTAHLIKRELGVDIGMPTKAAANPSPHMQARMQAVLGFIREHMRQHFYPPTVSKICAGAGISSTSMVKYYIDRMIADGALIAVNEPKAHSRYQLPAVIAAIQAIDWK